MTIKAIQYCLNLGRRPAPLLFGSLVLAFLSGCGGHSATGPTNPVPLTLVAQGTGGSAPGVPAAHATALSAASAATDTIPATYTKALLVIRDVRLVLADGMLAGEDQSDTLGTGGGDDDDGQVRFRGPFVLDLLQGEAARLDTVMVMPGEYRRVQGHLQALRSQDADAGTYPDLVGFTVCLEGMVEGEGGGPFTYVARIDNEFQIRGRFSVEAATPATAFITFDVSKWLQDRDGRFLDPRDPANDAAIQSAIRHSIKVGMDDDHDGEMDDDMHGEDGAN
jgi:hypothetical protein